MSTPQADREAPVFGERATTWDSRKRRARAAETAAAIAEVIDSTAVSDVLEIGAGTGLLSFALADRVDVAWQMTLTDVDDGMLAVAQEKIDAAGQTWRVERMDLTDGATREPAYDLLIAQMVLHHVDDLPALFAGMASVLRPGGIAVLVDLNADGVAFHWPRSHTTGWMSPEHLRALASDAQMAVVSYDEPLATTVSNAEGDEAEHRLFRLVLRREA